MSDEGSPTQSRDSDYLNGLLDWYHDRPQSNESRPYSGEYEPGTSRASQPGLEPLTTLVPGLEPLTNLVSVPSRAVDPSAERPQGPLTSRASQPGLEPLTNLVSVPSRAVDPSAERPQGPQTSMNPRTDSPVPVQSASPAELPAWEPLLDPRPAPSPPQRLRGSGTSEDPRPAPTPHRPAPTSSSGGADRNPLSAMGRAILNRATGSPAPVTTASTAHGGRRRLQKQNPAAGRGR